MHLKDGGQQFQRPPVILQGGLEVLLLHANVSQQ